MTVSGETITMLAATATDVRGIAIAGSPTSDLLALANSPLDIKIPLPQTKNPTLSLRADGRAVFAYVQRKERPEAADRAVARFFDPAGLPAQPPDEQKDAAPAEPDAATSSADAGMAGMSGGNGGMAAGSGQNFGGSGGRSDIDEGTPQTDVGSSGCSCTLGVARAESWSATSLVLALFLHGIFRRRRGSA